MLFYHVELSWFQHRTKHLLVPSNGIIALSGFLLHWSANDFSRCLSWNSLSVKSSFTVAIHSSRLATKTMRPWFCAPFCFIQTFPENVWWRAGTWPSALSGALVKPLWTACWEFAGENLYWTCNKSLLQIDSSKQRCLVELFSIGTCKSYLIQRWNSNRTPFFCVVLSFCSTPVFPLW